MPTVNESIRALLQGDTLPAKLAELRTPMLEVIDELARELLTSHQDPSETALRQRLLSDGSQTVAIMGQRGSGKSTLLAAVTAELLREARHLVVPIMRPDQFGEPDSVITTFLSELWDLVSSPDHRRSPEESDTAEVARDAEAVKLLADVARASAVARTTTSALEHGTESPIDFADDFLTVSRSGVRLNHQLRQLALHLCKPADESGESRLVIVPIDDPDLSRHSIIGILTDLQILSAVPGIVPLTCFSPDDLNAAWVAERHNLLPEASEGHLRFLLARQMEKAFPYRFRFEIEPIAPSQRPVFTPIAGTGTLQEKLATLRGEVERVSDCIWAVDEAFSLDQQLFGLRNALPDNARTLVQVWETLDALGATNEDTTAELLHLTLRRLFNLIGEPVAVRLGVPSSSMVQVGPPIADGVNRRALHFEFTRIDFLPSTDAEEAELTEPSLVAVSLRKLREVRAAHPRESGTRRSEYSAGDYLKPEEITAILALQEIGYGSGLFDITGHRLYYSTDDWRFLQKVQLANQATDDVFLLLPDATTLSEILRSAALWNELVDLSAEMTPLQIFATGIEAACLTVRREEKLTAQGDYGKAFERAAALYKECLSRQGSTAQAFVQWFERDLPLQWHSALLSGERIRSLVVKHREFSAYPARRDYREKIDTALFEKRLRFLLDGLENSDPEGEGSRHSWVAGYFELASALNVDQLERLSRIYPRWQRDSAGVRAGAATVGSLERRPSSRVRAAPYATPEGTELVSAAIAALRRARRVAHAESKHA